MCKCPHCDWSGNDVDALASHLFDEHAIPYQDDGEMKDLLGRPLPH